MIVAYYRLNGHSYGFVNHEYNREEIAYDTECGYQVVSAQYSEDIVSAKHHKRDRRIGKQSG